MEYDFIYKLKPLYEDLKRGGEGWWKLQWKPIKNGTYNLYVHSTMKSWSCRMLGIRYYETGVHNGWHRSWDGFTVEIGFWFFTVNFWIIWNIVVHEDGPSDVSERKKLSVFNLKGA